MCDEDLYADEALVAELSGFDDQFECDLDPFLYGETETIEAAEDEALSPERLSAETERFRLLALAEPTAPPQTSSTQPTDMANVARLLPRPARHRDPLPSSGEPPHQKRLIRRERELVGYLLKQLHPNANGGGSLAHALQQVAIAHGDESLHDLLPPLASDADPWQQLELLQRHRRHLEEATALLNAAIMVQTGLVKTTIPQSA